MHCEIDYDWMPLSTQPYLLECDIDLVKEALYILLHPISKNSDVSPESLQIANALNIYLKECNSAFLASENIRVFLLLSLLASLIISFITLATLPITAISITLVFITSLILFSVNVFTLSHQMSGYQQEVDWNKLKTYCSKYKEKLKENTLSNSLKKISSPTSAPCLFSARKNPQNDEFRQNTDENSLNNFEDHLPRIDENSYESSVESNDSSHLLFRNK